MLILGIVAVVLMLIICIATVVHLLGKYSKAKDDAERQRLRAVVAGNAARVAAGQPPIPGSGVDRSEIRPPPPPEPPPNRTSSGRIQTRTRPRPRQSLESTLDNRVRGLSDQMNQAFDSVSQAVNVVAAQISGISTSIARDAQYILDLGFSRANIDTTQGRRSNLQYLSTVPGVDDNTIRALQRLERSNREAEHMNWGSLVREFMRMIEAGELNFSETPTGVSLQTSTQPRVQAGTTPEAPKEEPKLPPTRFEREDVI